MKYIYCYDVTGVCMVQERLLQFVEYVFNEIVQDCRLQVYNSNAIILILNVHHLLAVDIPP